jgi:hypothetical protein
MVASAIATPNGKENCIKARIWRTEIDETRADEYREFAHARSLPMFRAQPGFAGVLFAAQGTQRAVITLWEDLAGAEALDKSPPTKRRSPRFRRRASSADTARSKCSSSRESSSRIGRPALALSLKLPSSRRIADALFARHAADNHLAAPHGRFADADRLRQRDAQHRSLVRLTRRTPVSQPANTCLRAGTNA